MSDGPRSVAILIRAAGGVPWRRRPDGQVEVLVVHRPRYDDWSFPKGKVKAGESDEEAALREVQELARMVRARRVRRSPRRDPGRPRADPGLDDRRRDRARWSSPGERLARQLVGWSVLPRAAFPPGASLAAHGGFFAVATDGYVRGSELGPPQTALVPRRLTLRSFSQACDHPESAPRGDAASELMTALAPAAAPA